MGMAIHKAFFYSHKESKFDSTVAKSHGTYIKEAAKNLPADHRYVTCCLSGEQSTVRVTADVIGSIEAAAKEVHRQVAISHAQQLRPIDKAKEPKKNTLGRSLLERM